MTDDANATAEEPTEEATATEAAGDAAEEAATADADAEPAASESADLVERVAAHDEDLAAEIEAERADFEERIDELESKLTRKQADFQNFKKRQQKKLEQQQARATEDLVERLLPVRDNLARALEQDGDADIREGVEGTLRELDRVLENEGAERIEPELGEEPDPERHEVLMRVESDRPAGTIEELYRPGYELGEKVIRTAQVTVSQE
ncbi:nucleotide exchange factor GrpE [Halolamina litorea]|uniref:Protein GrpE n=1 Tax=Halolamina litorea TaxID=1515593 RepID=A0ABD6BP80_9EURY|nr:nucleotide exchange factor GrpE [Halolamina litorea]